MNLLMRALVAMSGLAIACQAMATEPVTAPPLRIWATTADRSHALSELPATLPVIPSAPVVTIAVDPNDRHQSIVGFGASITDSSAWLLQRRMRPAARKALLRELFGPAPGIGLGFVRLTIGASDFSLHHYSLDDVPDGDNVRKPQRFRLPTQQRDVVAVTRAAQAINPQLRTMASPWSAPAWMKTNNSLIKGSLQDAHQAAFARYLTRYVDTLAAAGVPLFALTVQNEPAFEPENYPGMRLSAQQRARLIGHHLGPMLRAAGHQTRILEWDHNWDKPEEPTAVLSDPTAAAYIDGVAWHCYGGHVSAQSQVRERFPSKSAYLTECSGGDWEPVRSGGMTLLAHDLIVGATRHWASGVLLWNLALDQDAGPHAGGCGNCRGVVTIDSRTGAVTRNDEYYVLAHASRFVRPGAHRVSSDPGAESVDNVVFADSAAGTLTMIAVNSSEHPRTVSVVSPKVSFRYTLAAKSLYTFVWPEPTH